jgi:hypothetical protein
VLGLGDIHEVPDVVVRRDRLCNQEAAYAPQSCRAVQIASAADIEF